MMKAAAVAGLAAIWMAFTAPAQAVTIIADTSGSASYNGIDVNWILTSPAIQHAGVNERFKFSFFFDWNEIDTAAPFTFKSTSILPFTFDGRPGDVEILFQTLHYAPFNYFNSVGLNYDAEPIFRSPTDRFRIIGGAQSYGGYNSAQPFYVATLDFGFAEISGIPEPSTWAMMILGFGLCGALLRRRSNAARKLCAG